MTEQQNTPSEPVESGEGSRASVGNDVGRSGGGRTAGETTVDEATGSTDTE
jgi:hypothetical protein